MSNCCAWLGATLDRPYDGREGIKLFRKLPTKFKIDTRVGPYNRDWAIIKQEDERSGST